MLISVCLIKDGTKLFQSAAVFFRAGRCLWVVFGGEIGSPEMAAGDAEGSGNELNKTGFN